VWRNRVLNAVTTTQITNWDNTYNIVNANAGNWNSAFSYGNHQAVGYIVGLANATVTDGNIASWNGTTGKLLKDTSVAISSVNTAITHAGLTNNPHAVTKSQVGLTNVTDAAQVTSVSATSPIASSGGTTPNISVASGFIIPTTANSDNYNTAFGWGNHANAGYLLSSTASTTYQAIGNYATLTGGKISDSVLPAIAITDTSVVADESAMLALTAETGDIAIRTDVSKTFILSAAPATTLANWKEIISPTDGVTSVAVTVPTGLEVTGSPITNTGTIAIAYASGYALPTTTLQTNWNSAYSHISLTNNPHAVTKAQVGLTNVTDFAQVRKIPSVTSGNIPTWGDTSGANLGTGYTVQTTLASSTTALPRADAVFTAVGARATTATYNATITAGSWTGSDPFTKEITVTGITATDNPIIDLELSGVTFANVPTVQTAWGKIYRGVTTANTITFYATEALSVDIPFSAKVVR
jgi:hypothetical protein